VAQELEHITEDGEVITGPAPGGAIALIPSHETTPLAISLARAEIDQQITTARAYPRSLKRVMDNVFELATLDKESAAECVYALPRGGKPIKGPSIRLAEIISSQWGNCRVGARVVHVDRFEKFVEAEGVFHDLETNMQTTARVRRLISDKHGRLLKDDMIAVISNAACSIAKRNAILAGVPKGIWRKAYFAVESVLAGSVKTLVERREAMFKAFAAFGVAPEQIFTVMEVGGAEEIGVEEMVTLTGMHSALKSGEAQVEEMFPKTPEPGAQGRKGKSIAGNLDKLAGATKEPAGEAATTTVDATPVAQIAGTEQSGDATHDFPGDKPSTGAE
jgi:hypothetical protein